MIERNPQLRFKFSTARRAEWQRFHHELVPFHYRHALRYKYQYPFWEMVGNLHRYFLIPCLDYLVASSLLAASGLITVSLFWLIHRGNPIRPMQIHVHLSVSFSILAGWYAVSLDVSSRATGQIAPRKSRPVDSDRCKGTLDGVSDLGRLVDLSAVHSWAWDVRAGRAPEWIVPVAATGKSRGIGRTGWERPNAGSAHHEAAGRATGWLAYSTGPAPLPEVEAYAVLSEGTYICRLSRNAKH